MKGFIYAAEQPLALIAVDWEGTEVTECVMQCSANSWGKWKKDGTKLHPQTRDSQLTLLQVNYVTAMKLRGKSCSLA